MAWPKLSEVAVLTVNGRDYRDWESVSVKHELHGFPPYVCRFTCSEGMPIAKNFAVLQIKPGDHCTVTLAGFPAFSGRVMTRQVYYDANRHHIEIICGTFAELTTASVITQTGEWKNKTFQQIAQDVLGKLGIKVVFEGGEPPPYRFPRVSASPGENIVDFLDTLARGLGQHSDMAMAFTSNMQGDFVVIMGRNGEKDSVTEGKDILTGREIIYNQSSATSAPSVGQGPGTDQKWGAAANQVFANRSAGSEFNNPPPSVSVYEMPTTDKTLLMGRSFTENALQVGDEITLHITVHGWLRPSGGLWQRNQEVIVNSPMLMMNGDVLRAEEILFEQSNRGGTRTTLKLVNPLAGKSGAPIVPGR